MKLEPTIENNQCLHDLIESQAVCAPSRIAVIFDDESTQYGALWGHVENICADILAHNLPQGTHIGLLADRSLEMVAAYLAILKSGHVAVPLDVDNPQQRHGLIIQDAGIGQILIQDKLIERIDCFGANLMPIRICGARQSRMASASGKSSITHNSDAIMIYTSGSTGVPKGVMISHGNLVHYSNAIQTCLGLTPEDIYIHRGAISLVVSLRQLLVPLSIGAAVVITKKEEAMDPIQLMRLAKKTGVTVLDHVPSFWLNFKQILSQSPDRAGARELFKNNIRLLASGGEMVTSEIAQFWFAHFGQKVDFYNIYGQTEGTGVVSLQKIRKEHQTLSDSIPIGKAVAGMKLLLLDEGLHPVTTGTGEIYITGNGVSRGYWNEPDLNESKFPWINDPERAGEKCRAYRTDDLGRLNADGSITLIGRSDDQVQINGLRVELNEIQIALTSHHKINNAQVIVLEGGSRKTLLLAYLAVSPDAKPSVYEVRDFLATKIPRHMIPARYIFIDHFPLSDSGKVDRKLLHTREYYDLQHETDTCTPPENDTQRSLVKIWQRVLGHDRVGIRDSFYAIGGDSMSGMQLICEIESDLDISMPLEAIFSITSIEEMAQAIDEAGLQQVSPSQHLSYDQFKTLMSVQAGTGLQRLNRKSLIIEVNGEGSRPPLVWCFNSPGIELPAMAETLNRDQPVYGLLSSIALKNTQLDIDCVARHYVEEIISTFSGREIILGGNCRGAKVACEIYMLLAKTRRVYIPKICLVEFFHPCMYGFQGDLSLVFGKYSHLERHKLLNYGELGWEERFSNPPAVHWILCKHGSFFEKKHVTKLARALRMLMYGHDDVRLYSPAEEFCIRLKQWVRARIT